MTLESLQEIGREVGLPPELVAQAAHSLDRGGHAFTRRFAGLPLAVGRTVELDRKLTEAEWQRLVVDLRETFDARGSLRHEGAFRQWSNGNLQVMLEPIGDRERLRLRPLNGAARAWMLGGLALFVGIAAVALVALSGSAPAAEAFFTAPAIALMGAGSFTVGAFRLLGWARLRRRQMEEIADRVAASIRGPDRT